MNCNIIKNINLSDVTKEIKMIEDDISIMDLFIKDITTKLSQIHNFNSTYTQKNNIIDDENNIQLKLQTALLNNEKDHITHMKKAFFLNMFNELFNLSNNIIILITSFSSFDFNNKGNRTKADILKKIARLKQLTIIKITDISDSVEAIVNNINLIYEILQEFNDYIDEVATNIKSNNYHCYNIYTTLQHKHNFIQLEYTKFYNTLFNIIPHYKDLAAKIKFQMKHKAVLFYCLNNDVTGMDSDTTDTEDLLADNTANLFKTKKNNLYSIKEQYNNSNNVDSDNKLDIDNITELNKLELKTISLLNDNNISSSSSDSSRKSSPTHSLFKSHNTNNEGKKSILNKEQKKRDKELKKMKTVKNDTPPSSPNNSDTSIKSNKKVTLKSVVNKLIATSHISGGDKKGIIDTTKDKEGQHLKPKEGNDV